MGGSKRSWEGMRGPTAMVLALVVTVILASACGSKKTIINGSNPGGLPNNGFPVAGSTGGGTAGGTNEPFPPNTAFRFCIAIDPQGGTTLLEPAMTLSNPLAGTYSAVFRTGPGGPASGTGTAAPSGNPVVFSVPITQFGIYDDLQITGPDGSPIDLGSLATQLPLDINAKTDEPNDCDPDKLEAPTLAPAETLEPPDESTIAANHDAILAFLPEFEHAVRVDNVATLAATLDPAVIERYGVQRCAKVFRAAGADPTAAFTFKEFTSGPEPYDYVTDGKRTTVQNTYNVAIVRTAGGETSDGSMHLSVDPDGKVGWFTDCTP